MPQNINIVENNRNWYDTLISNGDAVVFQNMNYANGFNRSATRTRHRYIQDLNKQIIPNSIRQGVSLSFNSPSNAEITVSSGFAIVNGRFLEVPSVVLDTDSESLTSGTSYYIAIKVSTITESASRNPNDESADIRAIASSGYTPKHNELVLGKFTYNGIGNALTSTTSYVEEQEWQAKVISPPAADPSDGSTGSSIILRAGRVERVDNLGIETTTTRVYKDLTLEDQDSSPVGETRVINKDQITRFRDGSDTSYTSLGVLNLRTGGVQRLSSAGNLQNIGTLNTHTIPSGTDTITMLDATQTLTNKTLTSPTINNGQFNSIVLQTPEIDDTTQDHQYIFGVSELTADRTVTLPLLTGNDTFVFEDHTQTMTNKTLTTPVVSTLYQDVGKTNLITFPATSDTLIGKNTTDQLTNKTLDILVVRDSDDSNNIIFQAPGLTADRTVVIPSLSATSSENEFVMTDLTQTLTSKTLTKPIINDLSGATHTHSSAVEGGSFDVDNLTGFLPVTKGGTGLTSLTDNAVLIGNGTSSISLESGTSAQMLIVDGTGVPQFQTIGGDGSISNTGTLTIDNDSHTHDTRYYTESEVREITNTSSSTQHFQSCVYYGSNISTPVIIGTNDGKIYNSTTDNAKLFFELPLPPDKGSFVIALDRIEIGVDGDINNYVRDIELMYISSVGISNTITVESGGTHASGVLNFDFTELIVSGVKFIVALQTIIDTVGALSISHVSIRYRYLN